MFDKHIPLLSMYTLPCLRYKCTFEFDMLKEACEKDEWGGAK